MSNLNELIIAELRRTDIQDINKLIKYMNREKGFFWVRSGSHDHWTNGTAQHSWRVYQYMHFLWEHPEEIKCNRNSTSNSQRACPELATDKVRKLTEKEIIIAGLLHDLGKMHGNGKHELKSKNIIDDFLGQGFSLQNPAIAAAIFFHHDKSKDGKMLNQYKNCTLRYLLNEADSMASGTTWHSTRFKQQRSQRSGNHQNDTKHLRRVAMDRTLQVMDSHLYMDYQNTVHKIVGYSNRNIVWNVQDNIIRDIKSGNFKCLPQNHNEDFVTAAHWYHQNGKNITIAIGTDLSIPASYERNLKQNSPAEETLLICSNLIQAIYHARNIGEYRYAYTMRDSIKPHYNNQSEFKGILLPAVTFFRDGESEGFRMVDTWSCNILLMPGWNGHAIVETPTATAPL